TCSGPSRVLPSFPTRRSSDLEREILDMATRIASAGAQIGLTEGEVLGFAAALSSVGIEAEAGGTAISKVMLLTRNAVMDGGEARSEEHTSELQSRENLVCRLL